MQARIHVVSVSSLRHHPIPMASCTRSPKHSHLPVFSTSATSPVLATRPADLCDGIVTEAVLGCVFMANKGCIRGQRRPKRAVFACKGARKLFWRPKKEKFAETNLVPAPFVKVQCAPHLGVSTEPPRAEAMDMCVSEPRCTQIIRG